MISMHMKRYSIPKYWKVPKKEMKFITTPRPGPHKKSDCIPLLILLRDVLKFADSSREAGRAINSGEILVDKRPRKDPNYPVGLMDVVEMPNAKKYYRVSAGKGGLRLDEISKKSSGEKLCRIRDKRTLRGGIVQLSLHDGRNINTEKNVYKPGDSVVISLPGQKITKHYKFAKKSPATIVAGKNMGAKGSVKDIFGRSSLSGSNRAIIKTKDGEIETVKEYVLVGEVK